MWNDLPDIITTHWGADGNADGLSGKVFAVFGTPIILLIFHFVCLLFTSLDKKQKDQNQNWEWFFGFFRLYPFSQTE